ncbi:MAG: hypothetical protein DRJ03_07405 [Chloroflexi bacterium]|nr:MAG: hypothetical protein DRJ03_07405 [Chloroflexota bacterium]
MIIVMCFVYWICFVLLAIVEIFLVILLALRIVDEIREVTVSLVLLIINAWVIFYVASQLKISTIEAFYMIKELIC